MEESPAPVVASAAAEQARNEEKKTTESENKQSADDKVVLGWRFWAIFVNLALTAFLSTVEGSIVATALPTISRALQASEDYIWVVNAYYLSSAVSQPLYGQVADRWGRKWPMLTAVAIFIAGSGVCGGAENVNTLIGGRALQGIGAGGINMLIELILCDQLPLRQRGQFMGLLFVFIVLGSVVGPLLGGVLTEEVSWRWVFYINLPLGGVCLVLLFLVLPWDNRSGGSFLSKIRTIDFTGNLLLAAAVASCLYALTYGGTRYNWTHASILVSLILGLLGHFVFALYEASPLCKEPVMPGQLFQNRTSVAGFILTFIQTAVSFWASYFLPLYFQSVKLVSPSQSGVDILPFAICYSLGALVGGSLATKLGYFRIVHFVGFAIMVIGLGTFTILDAQTSTAVWVILQIIYAIGLGIVMACLLISIQAALPDSLNAASTGTFAFVRSVGTIWGVSIPAAIFNNKFDQLLPRLNDVQAEQALARGRAYEQASKAFVNSFAEPTRSIIIQLYVESLRFVWQIGIVFAGVGFLVVFLEKDLILRATRDVDGGEDEKRDEAPGESS